MRSVIEEGPEFGCLLGVYIYIYIPLKITASWEKSVSNLAHYKLCYPKVPTKLSKNFEYNN